MKQSFPQSIILQRNNFSLLSYWHVKNEIKQNEIPYSQLCADGIRVGYKRIVNYLVHVTCKTDKF